MGEIFPEIINYIALGLLFIGFYGILQSNFLLRDRAFLLGTSLLVIGALISWSITPQLSILAFALLFGVQVGANIFQLTIKNDRVRTNLLLSISFTLFIFFFLTGLFENTLFLLIAFGMAITGLGYKEKPENTVRQSIFFVIGSSFELLFAFFTNQAFYVILNIAFILLAVLIMHNGMKGKIITKP